MVGVLDGIRVADFSRVFAAPEATQLLGDLGAEVIKVEEPSGGDNARVFGVSEESHRRFGGVSAAFLALNRNKRSLAIDLRTEAGREVARTLLKTVDVAIHNFRPGTMAKWGLDYESVRGDNPRLIYCEFSAYGQTGPMAHFGANDVGLQAHSGLISITGDPDRPGVRSGTSVIDLNGGMIASAAILAALLHREKSGRGQHVETSLLLSSAQLMNYFYTEYWLTGSEHKRMGTANHLNVPNQAFETGDGAVIIIAGNDAMWNRCANALDGERLDLPQFRSFSERRRRREELVAAVTEVTGRMTSDEVVRRLSAVRVNVSKVNTIGEAATDPQLAAIGGIVDFDYDGHNVKSVATPFTMSETPGKLTRVPPKLGEQTLEVLEELGFDLADIDRLQHAGALGPRDTSENGE